MSIDHLQINPSGGYWRHDATDEFPFHIHSKGVWCSLFIPTASGIRVHGYTGSDTNRKMLLSDLRSIEDGDGVMLIGVWHGNWNTHLYVLDRQLAIEKLALQFE